MARRAIFDSLDKTQTISLILLILASVYNEVFPVASLKIDSIYMEITEQFQEKK